MAKLIDDLTDEDHAAVVAALCNRQELSQGVGAVLRIARARLNRHPTLRRLHRFA
jgi:hypothetical protein